MCDVTLMGRHNAASLKQADYLERSFRAGVRESRVRVHYVCIYGRAQVRQRRVHVRHDCAIKFLRCGSKTECAEAASMCSKTRPYIFRMREGRIYGSAESLSALNIACICIGEFAIFTKCFMFANFANFWRARSRLYRSRVVNGNTKCGECF